MENYLSYISIEILLREGERKRKERSNISWLDLIKKQIVCLTIQYNHNRVQSMNMSIGERINSHLHFWHHHQIYTLPLKSEEREREGREGGRKGQRGGRRRRRGSDEWLFVAVAVIMVPMLIYFLWWSQYVLICWQEFNHAPIERREKEKNDSNVWIIYAIHLTIPPTKEHIVWSDLIEP